MLLISFRWRRGESLCTTTDRLDETSTWTFVVQGAYGKSGDNYARGKRHQGKVASTPTFRSAEDTAKPTREHCIKYVRFCALLSHEFANYNGVPMISTFSCNLYRSFIAFRKLFTHSSGLSLRSGFILFSYGSTLNRTLKPT